MISYCRRERIKSRTPPPSAAARRIAPPPSKNNVPVSRGSSPAGAGVGRDAVRTGVPGNGCAVAAAKTFGGCVAAGVSSSAGSTTLVVMISREGAAVGLAVASWCERRRSYRGRDTCKHGGRLRLRSTRRGAHDARTNRCCGR